MSAGAQGNVNPETEPYWTGLREHRLMMQRCESCGYIRARHSWICPECLSGDYTWATMSGAGSVQTFVWYLRHMHPVPAEITREVPYNVAVVELEEGPRLMTNVIEVEFGELRVGDEVHVRFVDQDDGSTRLQFVPA